MQTPSLPEVPPALVLGTIVGFVVSPQFEPLIPVPTVAEVALPLAIAGGVGFAAGRGLLALWELLTRNGRIGAQPDAGWDGLIWPEGTYDPAVGSEWRFRKKGMQWNFANIPPSSYPVDEECGPPIQLPPGQYITAPKVQTEKRAESGEVYSEDAFLYIESGNGPPGLNNLWNFARITGLSTDGTFTIRVGSFNPEAKPFPARPGIKPAPAPVRPIKPAPAEPLPQPEPAGDPLRPLKPLPPLVVPTTPERDREPGVPPQIRPDPVPATPEVIPDPGPGRQPIRPDGTPEPMPQPLPKPTPPWQEIPWPGGNPIGDPAERPRPDWNGIASELGRLEEKHRQTIGSRPNGPGPVSISEVGDLVMDLLSKIAGIDPGGEYKLWSACVPVKDPGGKENPLKVPHGEAETTLMGLRHRVDALAMLIQDALLLPQPSCRKPQINGQWVSVNFESIDVSPVGGKTPLRKILRYRDQTAAPLEDHVKHWAGFEWDAGPVCVISKGAVWGVPQVWAKTAAEGQRVIRHAAAIAGVSLDGAGHEWVITHSSSGRIGQHGKMRVRPLVDGGLMISKRDGSDGTPEYLNP